MSKNWWLVIGGGLAAIVVAAVVGIVNQRRGGVPAAGISPVVATPTPAGPAGLTTYQDPAGLSFQYPASLLVTDETPEDDVHYTLLSLKNSQGEMMRIRVKDVTVKSADDWILSGETSLNADSESLGGVTLGSMAAAQYRQSGKLYTIAVDKEVLYELVSPAEQGFWSEAHQQVVKSFSFMTAGDNTSTGADSTTYEAEEVVE